MQPIIINFKNHLRVEDNPLLIYAASIGKPVIPVWINSGSARGAASKVWLKESLQTLEIKLKGLGLSLIIREGDETEELKKLSEESFADEIKGEARNTLFNPKTIRNKSGGVFKVFTPYYKHCLTLDEESIHNNFKKELVSIKELKRKLNCSFDCSKLKTIKIENLDFRLKNQNQWQEKILRDWVPGEEGAIQELKRFLSDDIESYPEARDQPALKGTSRLSSHLHFGEISPFRVWLEVSKAENSKAHAAYLRQLVWREFAIYTLFHFPHSANKNLDTKFDTFPWKKDPEGLKLWQKGLTGYPIVDAGMRELWETGWMHNRVRMVVGSFLVKDLLVHWTEGAEWFWETLFDADLANNSMGWQWVAGSGVDASPYFRVFNPSLQSEKFDKEAKYIRKWCPELSKLDNKWLHKPFEAPPLILQAAGIELGKDYPKPIVNHKEARERALAALKTIKKIQTV